ncbi:hypothetical protein ACMXYW_06570 [Neptuniibacter sp. QD48_55]|uniref:hypothetical protein n=1 Tax=Neptuniibacter sp. QD48_55 TaxID=3398212 RepID=UPI0039F4C9A0
MTDNQPQSLVEFKKISHAYHIAYSMASHGMLKTKTDLENLEGMNPEGLFQVGNGPPEKGKTIAEIPTKFALSGMDKNGPFSQLIANGIIVLLYELWNEDYRSKISDELGCATNEVMCDVMGDLRLIRNWITHAGSCADTKIKNLKVLKWPNQEGPFVATQIEMDAIQLEINTMNVYTKMHSNAK